MNQLNENRSNVLPLPAPSKIVVSIDDDADFHQLLAMVFQRNEVENRLMLFRDGQEFLQFLAAKPTHCTSHIGLVLVDINMPVLTGFELIQRLQTDFADRLPETEISVFTSSESAGDAKKCTAAGVGRIVKPLNMFKLALEPSAAS